MVVYLRVVWGVMLEKWSMEVDYIADETALVKTKEIKTYVVVVHCKKCGSELRATGATLASNPPWYSHFCPTCNWSANLHKKYPYTEDNRRKHELETW